jgi:hypothetical protein
MRLQRGKSIKPCRISWLACHSMAGTISHQQPAERDWRERLAAGGYLAWKALSLRHTDPLAAHASGWRPEAPIAPSGALEANRCNEGFNQEALKAITE